MKIDGVDIPPLLYIYLKALVREMDRFLANGK